LYKYMQYKVPQNIDMEDKIVGPLTLIQFLYLMGGGIIIYVARSMVSVSVFFLIAIPVALLSLSLAFVKIQDRPFANFLLSLALYFVRPRSRNWKKVPELESNKIILKKEEKKEEKKVYKNKTLSEVNLEELSYVLDTHGLATNKKKTSVAPEQEIKSDTK